MRGPAGPTRERRSTAGVALANAFPEAKSVTRWVSQGWHVTVAYVVGFFVLLAVMGWHPNERHKPLPGAVPATQGAVQSPADVGL